MCLIFLRVFNVELLTATQGFTAEYDSQDVIKLHTWNQCKCPELPGYRVPSCACQVPGISTLLQIRWKRLVIDEGHVSAALSTALVAFTKQLSVERRWIVTGTPTTNLLGLSLGSKVTECLESPSKKERRDDSFAVGELEAEEQYWSEAPSAFSSQTTAAGTPPPTTPIKRIWNKYDREDLNKLGNMITHFIAVPQFSADSSLIATHVTEALLDPSGPRRGAIEVLNQVMHSVMIRHRIEDVEMDVVLPPVTHESVLLDLDPYVIKSFNALQAAIVVNAVDSERKDQVCFKTLNFLFVYTENTLQDYLFHPRVCFCSISVLASCDFFFQNVEFLQETVQNMSQYVVAVHTTAEIYISTLRLLFYRVDDQLYNADELVKNANEHIQRALKRGVSEEDLSLLRSAFKHLYVMRTLICRDLPATPHQ